MSRHTITNKEWWSCVGFDTCSYQFTAQTRGHRQTRLGVPAKFNRTAALMGTVWQPPSGAPLYCTGGIDGRTQPQGCIEQNPIHPATPASKIGPTQRRSNRTRADKHHTMINLEQSNSQGLEKSAWHLKSYQKEKGHGCLEESPS